MNTAGDQSKKIEEEPNGDNLLLSSLNSIPRGKQRQINKYLEPNDHLEMDQHAFKNREPKSVESDRKDTRDEAKMKQRVSDIKGTSPDGSDLLFGNNENNVEPQEGDKRVYNNNEPAESSEQERYFKHFYNTMQVEHRGNMPDNTYENQYNLNRDRREIDSISKDDHNTIVVTNDANDNEQLLNPSTETEEAAIKRHVKKLSSKELEELLASLSDDKRELLKKIMSDDSEFRIDNLNKRDITKKSEAAASDNSFLEGGHLEVSKLQEGSSSGDGAGDGQASVGTDNSKQTETTEVTELTANNSNPSSTCATSDVKVDSREHIDEMKQDKSKNDASVIDSNKDQGNIDDQSSMKSAIKREANMADFSDVDVDENKLLDNNFDAQELSNEQGYNMCPQDDEFSEVIYDDSQLHNANGNSLKREAHISDSMKSLEESFPNSNAYDDANPYADTLLAPLVRVKRRNTNLMMKKRAAAFSPEANVAYCPYRAENDDEDNDEGNEFDDDGFFDRTSNLAKSNLNVKSQGKLPVYIDTPKHLKTISKYSKSKNIGTKNLQIENMESDKMSLGSDTDGVISGVEGVDDNLMYNSAFRNKRSKEYSKADDKFDDAKPKIDRLARSTPFMDDEVQTASENLISTAVASYQESDAFGSLPRNYEGVLARYKRIRRVKQLPNKDVESSDT